jgi:hypothetical protein
MNKTELPDNYPQWLASLKQQIACALRIPVKVATQSMGMLPPKPVKAATPSGAE